MPLSSKNGGFTPGPTLILQVMGPNAGESPQKIFVRKIIDTDPLGEFKMTYWYARTGLTVQQVRRMAAKADQGKAALELVIVSQKPNQPRRDTPPSVTHETASQYSEDSLVWKDLPDGLSPVTGYDLSSGVALVLETITILKPTETIDLNEYSKFETSGEPIIYLRTLAYFGAVPTKAANDGMKSHKRDLIAVARLKQPYAVFVR